MAWRKWLVRGLVFTAFAALAAAGLLYQHWTNPTAVRRQVLEQLNKHFVGARVSMDSADLRVFAGVTLTDVRFYRRNPDDFDSAEFAIIPTAVVCLDKEHLLGGRQVIRKIELDRPRLRIVRDQQGRWNLAGVLGKVEPDKPLPTLVVQRGTVFFEDRLTAPGAPPLEVRDVSLTIINDPPGVLVIEGTGHSDLGPVRVRARLQRDTFAVTASVEAGAVPVGPPLVQRLAGYCPELAAHARQLEGVGRVQAELAYHPESAQRWEVNVNAGLSRGKLVHARLPMPLEQLEASCRYDNGRVPVAHFKARSGPTTFDLTLKDLDPALRCESFEERFRELELKVAHLPLSDELFASLPESVRSVRDHFQPAGVVGVEYTIRRDAGGVCNKHCVIKPEDARAECARFPYEVEHIAGTIDHATHGDEDVITLDLVGKAGARPVHVRGEVRQPKPVGGISAPSAVAVEVWGENIPLDDKLLHALQPKQQELARSFHPRGLADFRASIRREGGSREFANRYVIRFHDAAVRYDQFACPLEEVGGVLDIQPGRWEFRDFRGTHKGGVFEAAGRSVSRPDGDGVVMDIRGTGILLDDELRGALQPELQKTWDEFAPTGRINCTGTIDIPPGPAKTVKPDIDLTVTALGCSIRPAFFKYTLSELTGTFRYARHWVQLDGLQARHGASALSLGTGLAYLKPGGGVWTELTDLRANPLLPDEDFRAALPGPLRKACVSLDLKDPLAVSTRLVIDTPAEAGAPPVIYWDGGVALRGASVRTGVDWQDVRGVVACRGLYNGRQLEGVQGNLDLEQATAFGQPLRELRSHLEVSRDEPEVLKLAGLHARFCGGEVYGPVRVEFGPTLRYELNLTASQVKLEEFGRLNLGAKSDLSGLATAQLYLTGQGPDLAGLKGGGSIDVPSGKMYNLPLLLDLLKFLGLRLPDRTAFEEAHAKFDLEGTRVHVNRLDLYGHAISLRGQGDVGLSPIDLNLDFSVDWARFTQVLPPGIRAIPPAISDQLLRIKMRGQPGDVKFEKDVVPLVTDSMRRMMGGRRPEQWRGSMGAPGN